MHLPNPTAREYGARFVWCKSTDALYSPKWDWSSMKAPETNANKRILISLVSKAKKHHHGTNVHFNKQLLKRESRDKKKNCAPLLCGCLIIHTKLDDYADEFIFCSLQFCILFRADASFQRPVFAQFGLMYSSLIPTLTSIIIPQCYKALTASDRTIRMLA